MPSVNALPAPGQDPLPAWPGQRRRVGQFDLYVRAAGLGEPAVFVHGLGGSSTNWTDLMALLGDRLEGLAPDLPGHGRSPASPDGRYSLRVHADAVEALIDDWGRGPVHLFGNSLGGAVTTLLAGRRPDLVRSLTLISPAFPQLDPRQAADTRVAALLLPGVERLARKRLAQVPVEQRTRAVLELCYFDVSRVHQQRLAEEAAEAKARMDQPHAEVAFIRSLRGLIWSYLRLGRWSLWRSAGSVTAPVQLIWGEHDKLVPVLLAPRVQRAFARAAGGAQLTVFDAAGHVAQMELPERTAELVAARLDGAQAVPAPIDASGQPV